MCWRVAAEVSGWPAWALQSAGGLALTQAAAFVRPARAGWADLRRLPAAPVPIPAAQPRSAAQLALLNQPRRRQVLAATNDAM